MGKPMGNGHPIAAMAARPEVLANFAKTARYFNTFGGNSVSTAVAGAVLDVIEDEGLIANAASMGAYFLAGVRGMASPRFGNIRGAGLYLGVDLITPSGAPDADAAKRVVNSLRDKGVLIGSASPAGNALKIRPPLPIDRAAADFFLQALGDTLTELGAP